MEAGGTAYLSLPPDVETILVSRGAISLVSAPPIAVLDGWKDRAPRLEELGIITVVDLLGADVPELSKGLGLSQATVKRWQRQASLEIQT